MHGTRALAQFMHPPDRLSHLTLRWAQRTHEKFFCAVVVESGVVAVVFEDEGGAVDAIQKDLLRVVSVPAVSPKRLHLLAEE